MLMIVTQHQGVERFEGASVTHNMGYRGGYCLHPMHFIGTHNAVVVHRVERPRA